MSLLKKGYIFLFLAAYCVQADKYTDENRPYEFGFTIEGEQHRHEKKDENGIIMGEFGFITADGVYHVTVYATDENGNFKIISMKNIRVKPYPSAPNQNFRQGHSLTLQNQATTKTNNGVQQLKQQDSVSPQSNVITKTNNGAQLLKQQVNSSPQTKAFAKANTVAQHSKQEDNSGPAKTCSHCSVPTTSTPSPKLPSEQFVYGNNQETENKYGTQFQSNSNFFNQENNLQQNLQHHNILEKTGTELNSYNPNPISNKNEVATGQQNTQNFINNQPSREISTPAISNYPQSYNEGQNIPVKPADEPASLQNSPQIFGNYPQNPNVGQQHSESSPRLSSNSGDDYPLIYQQPNIAGPGQISKDSEIGTNKFTPKTYNANQNVPFDNEGNNGQQNNIPQNNVNRQPKSFNDILESVGPDNKYNIDIQTPDSSLSGITTPSKKPVLIAAQMQIVDKNTDVYHKNPGEKDGLPQGLTKNDMNQLLYTFNYTLGFHGHHEEGYTNGVKIGYYFVTGRNGVRTRVDYTADETGFHPKISQEVLDIFSEDVPKPETEKDDKYGLKGYEFKWLYYPVDSS